MSDLKLALGDSGMAKQLSSRIADAICDYIVEHNINIGQKLPSERNMAAMLGVSRASLREALQELETRGVISIEAGRGSFVIGDGTDKSVMIKIQKKNFFQQFEIKTVLEGYIIQKLVPIISNETLEQLENVAMQMNALCEVGVFPQELDNVFHKLLLSAYDNQEMIRMVEEMIQIFGRYNDSYFGYCEGVVNDSNQSLRDTIPLHLEMIKKMKERDAAAVEEIYQRIVELDIQIYSLVKEG